jgi:hypothetical protein
VRSVITREKSRAFALALLAALGACGEDDSQLTPFEATVADCGSSLDVLFDVSDPNTQPSLDATYSQALATWTFEDPGCGLGVFTGSCADGKRLLYRNGGFGSEIRYFDGEQLVGYVQSGDVGFCPSVCPFSRYFGAIESVRCDVPTFEDLCASSSLVLDGVVTMPFANGKAPGGCDI